MHYRKIPSLNWLRVFEAAARLESFSAAARLLNMSPSAISQQINALEAHLGTSLFERLPRSVRLTKTGAAFLPSVRQGLGSIESTAATLFGGAGREKVKIQADTIFATGWLSPRIKEFRDHHPEIEIQVICSDQYEDLHDHNVDIRIAFGAMDHAWGETHSLFSQTVYPVAIPTIAKRVDSLENLAGQPLIEVNAHWLGWIQFLGYAGLDLTRQLDLTTTSTTAMALTLAASGSGIALARAPATLWLEEKFGLLPCLRDHGIRGDETYYLTCRPANEQNRGSQLMVRWLRKRAADS